jgi:hypothetical protein
MPWFYCKNYKLTATLCFLFMLLDSAIVVALTLHHLFYFHDRK